MIRTASGRPLRFFAIVMTGWVMARALSPDAMLPIPVLPSAPPLQAATPAAHLTGQDRKIASVMRAVSYTSLNLERRLPFSTTADRPVVRLPRREQTKLPPPPSAAARHFTDGDDMTVDMMNFIRFSVAFANRHYASDPHYMSGLHMLTAGPPPAMSSGHMADRWRAGAWMLWRPDGGENENAVPGGRLGGSQLGGRLEYSLTTGGGPRLAAFGRLTGALERPTAPEAAVGLSVQPLRAVPISIAMERRVALGAGARNANSVMAVGGFGPAQIAPAIHAEAYAQAGIVGFKRQDGFIDGKLSLSTPVSQTAFRLGAALSGGAQPGVSRLDIGPDLQMRLPLPQGGARLSIEWRQRIAGDARPGSGLAVTIAADF